MAPTHFYPMLGKADFDGNGSSAAAGPTDAQVLTMVRRHLTNSSRFCVWPSASMPPTVPLEGARPLVQWQQRFKPTASEANRTAVYKPPPVDTVLCCSLACNFALRDRLPKGSVAN